MINESRYILRRILIGVGVVLVLSFIRSCKVKAVNIQTIDYDNGVNSVSFDVDLDQFPYYVLSYNRRNNRYFLWQYTNKPTLYESVSNPGTPIINYSWGIKQTSANYCKSRYIVETDTYDLKYDCYNSMGEDWFSFDTMENALSTGVYSTYKYVLLANFDLEIVGNYNIDYFITHNANTYSSSPTFVSFNAIPITNNNVITSYTIQPEFSSFDTDNFVYQYSFDSNRWLSLTENQQLLRINNNSSIYVRIKDISNNEIIDTANFTITNIGTFYNEQTYNINFSGNYRTENYLNNNISSNSQSTIVEYQIYIDYLPKSSLLTYQYQYVPTNSQLDDNNWQNVSSSDNGSITYVANENGVLYARILDKEDNILKSSTFTVNSIGLLAFDNNETGTNNFFEKLRNKINYGGPVSSLFILPVSFFSNLYNSMDNSNTCSNIQLGSLLGTNLSLTCVDIPRYLGSNVYNIIDFIFSFILLVGIFRFVIKKYNKFISMQDIGDDL